MSENTASVKQAAQFLNVTPGYIYNLVYFGKLTGYKPGGKILLFKQSDLEKYAFGNPRGNKADTADKILNKKKKR